MNTRWLRHWEERPSHTVLTPHTYFLHIFHSYLFIFPWNGQHRSRDDCPDAKSEDYQNCYAMYNVYLCTVTSTHTSLSFMINLSSLFSFGIIMLSSLFFWQWYALKGWLAKIKPAPVTRTLPFKSASRRNERRQYHRNSIQSGTRNSSCAFDSFFTCVVLQGGPERQSIELNRLLATICMVIEVFLDLYRRNWETDLEYFPAFD